MTENEAPIMITPTFEIKVALLGYVSVGKTTVLNALLQDKFSEVSMRRTTAGVNFFRIVTQPNGTSNHEGMEWSPLADDDESLRTAISTLVEITQDNKILREETTVQEKTFNVELAKPLCEMRKDTTLVLVDVPGLNEAGSKKMYLNYVADKWDTFDCVIIVMDAEKGVNTEEQVELLKLVKQKLDVDKHIPVLVLCNKVDDPEDDELMELVGEVRTKVEQIFNVGSREDSLNQLLTACREGKRCVGESSNPVSTPTAALNGRRSLTRSLAAALQDDMRSGGASVYPVFIPLSAGNAFAFRTAANRPYGTFKELDLKLIDKIGRDEVGNHKWKKLPLEKKYKTAFDVMKDAEQYQERLETTNFDKFLLALSYSIGGDDVQRRLLDLQVQVSLRKLSGGSPVIEYLRAIYGKCVAIDSDPRRLKDAFWKSFGNSGVKAFTRVASDVDSTALAATFDELIAYREFVHEVGWDEEEGNIVNQMVALVGEQVRFVLQKEGEWQIDGAALSRQGPRSRMNHTTQGCTKLELRSGKKLRSKRNSSGSYRDYKPTTCYDYEEQWPWTWKRNINGWQNIYTHEQRASTENPGAVVVTWASLTYHDWATIIGSLLLMTCNRHFCERFGREKMLLEGLLQRHTFYLNCLTTGKTAAETNALANISVFSEGTYVNGKFVPSDPAKYNVVAQVAAPELISDPSHWGHVIWKFCSFMGDRQGSHVA